MMLLGEWLCFQLGFESTAVPNVQILVLAQYGNLCRELRHLPEERVNQETTLNIEARHRSVVIHPVFESAYGGVERR